MNGNAGIAGEQAVVADYQHPTLPLKLNITPETNYLLKGVKNKLRVLFQYETGQCEEDQAKKRMPIDLSIVLDRSGSMGGPKLENSKKAVIKILENLQDGDTVHFIVYDDTASIVFKSQNASAQNREVLISQVQKVRQQGCTNMGEGLERAFECLKDSKAKSKRIFLFSDGLVNRGSMRKKSELCDYVGNLKVQHGINTTTFGIGQDFDEDLMTSLSEYGQSMYFFIESADKIETYVGGALGALVGRIGMNATLKLRGAGGAIVTKIHGHDDIVKGACLGDIKSNNTKSILIEMEVSPAQDEVMEFLTWELVFDSVSNDKTISLKGTKSIRLTEDSSKLDKKNDDVIVAVKMQEAADADERTTMLLDQGDLQGAMANHQSNIFCLQEVRSRDRTGRAAAMIEREEEQMVRMKTEGLSKNVKKAAKYHAKLKRFDSADFIHLK